MKTPHLSFPFLAALCLLACDVEPMTSSDAPDEEFRDASPFSAEELYVQLRDLSDEFPLPQPTQVVEVGTFNPSTGQFDGLESIDGFYDPELGIVVPPSPAAANISAVRAVLRFRVVGSAAMTVTVDGRAHLKGASSSYIDIDVGTDDLVQWSVSSQGRTHSDQLVIGRSGVDGLGAFQVEAWPVGLLYEPPTNAAQTNAASFSHVTQRSSSTSMGQTEESSRFVELTSLENRIHAVANKAPSSHPVGLIVSHLDELMGTVNVKVSEGSSVSSENTLEVATSELLSVTTNADLGPGRGDVVAYLKNPRLAWVMLNGDVTVTLIDYEATEFRAVSQLRSDLLSVRNGGTAAHTGLSEESLEALLELDPFFTGETSELGSGRFEFAQTISVGGADVAVSLSHTQTATDRSAQTSFTGRVVDTQASWLSVVGLASITTTGQTTTKITQSSSRSVSVGETTTAGFQLGALPDESYTVEAYYDRVFGTFALRRPDACPFFDPLHPDGGLCDDPACPCENGAGDCDNDAQCADGLFCGHDIGAQFGLPSSWDVCVDEIVCQPFNPDLPNGSFCSADCPCGDGEGDCDSDAQCQDGLFCAHDVGPQFGLPANWDVCVAELECPEYDPSQPDAEFCSSTCPCDIAEGDCDSDAECAGALTCADNVGAKYGLPSFWDMCEVPQVVTPFPFPTIPALPFPG